MLTYDPERSCYDTACAAIDEEWFADQPWNMYQWHPDGAHFQHLRRPVAVVVTDWTADDSYDVGIYAAADEYDDALMNEAAAYLSVPTDALPATLRGLLSGEAERIVDRARMATTVPLTADMLATKYLADVRRNGAENVIAVAEADEHDYLYEIRAEIVEGWNCDAARRGMPEFHPVGEHDDRTLDAAAGFAVMVCRIEAGRFGA